MKPLLKALVAALILTCALTANAAAAGFVHQDGRNIADGNGKRLWLNGVNVGGFLMWEGWIIGGGPTAETPMTDKLTTLVGADRAARFRQDVRDTFVTRADFQAMKSMGVNTVRVPFNHRLLDEDANGGFKTLDRLVADAKATGIHIVLDLHGAPGGQNPGFISDPELNRNYLWLSPASQAATVELWRRVAARYANEPTIAGYDLLNEPSAPSAAALMGLYTRIVAGIRSVDRNHLLFLEGNAYAKDFSGFSRIDGNMAYSFHQYPLDKGDPDVMINTWVAQANAANVPLWNGEFGQSNVQTVGGQMRRFRAQPGVDGHTMWTWKLANRNLFFGTPGPSAPAPVKFVATDAWMDVVSYLSLPGAPKPTAARAEQGLQSFITESSYSRNAADSGLASLLRNDSAAATTTRQAPAAAAPAPAANPVVAAPGAGTVAVRQPVADTSPTTGTTGTTPRAKARKCRVAVKRKTSRRAKAVHGRKATRRTKVRSTCRAAKKTTRRR